MNPDDNNRAQEPAEHLADLEVAADETDKTIGGTGGIGKVQMQDFHFVVKSEPDLNKLTS